MNKQVIGFLKIGRTVADPEANGWDSARDLFQDSTGVRLPTKEGMRGAFGDLRGIGRSVRGILPDLTRQAESDAGGRTLNEGEREAFSAIVNEADRLRGDAADIESLEDVYTGEEEPQEAIMNRDVPSLTRRAAKTCEAGYVEFPIDDETSTCVFASLVERNCYAGSRRVPGLDLGSADVCLYYSLDFFQAGGSCRENYSRVQYQGRETCRWSELGPSQPPWYTLHKELAGQPPPSGELCCDYPAPGIPGNNRLCSCPFTTDGGLDEGGYCAFLGGQLVADCSYGTCCDSGVSCSCSTLVTGICWYGELVDSCSGAGNLGASGVPDPLGVIDLLKGEGRQPWLFGKGEVSRFRSNSLDTLPNPPRVGAN